MPDLKVVYVRFIPADLEAGGDADMTSTTRKRKISQRNAQSSTFKDFLPPKAKSSPSNQKLPACTRSTYYPRSLSISDMIMIMIMIMINVKGMVFKQEDRIGFINQRFWV